MQRFFVVNAAVLLAAGKFLCPGKGSSAETREEGFILELPLNAWCLIHSLPFHRLCTHTLTLALQIVAAKPCVGFAICRLQRAFVGKLASSPPRHRSTSSRVPHAGFPRRRKRRRRQGLGAFLKGQSCCSVGLCADNGKLTQPPPRGNVSSGDSSRPSGPWILLIPRGAPSCGFDLQCDHGSPVSGMPAHHLPLLACQRLKPLSPDKGSYPGDSFLPAPGDGRQPVTQQGLGWGLGPASSHPS